MGFFFFTWCQEAHEGAHECVVGNSASEGGGHRDESESAGEGGGHE